MERTSTGTRWPVVATPIGLTLLIHGGAWGLLELVHPPPKPMCPTQTEMCVARCVWDREPEVPVGCEQTRPCSCELIPVDSPVTLAPSTTPQPPLEVIPPVVAPSAAEPPPPPETVPDSPPESSSGREDTKREAAKRDRDAAVARSVSIARILGSYAGPNEGTLFDLDASTHNSLDDLLSQGIAPTQGTPRGDMGAAAGGGGSVAGLDLNPASKVPRATASLSEIEIGSDADAAGLRKAIAARAKQLTWCYERELKTDPGLAGSIAVTLAIADGRVVSVVVAERGLDSAGLRACVKSKAARWHFDTPGENELTFSVVFAAE